MKLQKNHERRSSEKPHGGKPSVKGPWRVTTPKGVKSWSGGVTTHNDASTGDESYILTETDLDATGRWGGERVSRFEERRQNNQVGSLLIRTWNPWIG
jgi:hypothetical protein